MKKLCSANFRRMPWKNGAGTTIEIAVYPENAALDAFIWRVSRAQVNDDGSFSHFDGIDRSLALLEGAGMRLTVNDVVKTVDQNNPVVIFSGDATTYAELIDGAIGDFNLMSRRALCSHELTRWTGETVAQLPADTVLVYCAAGSGKLVGKDQVFTLNKDETLQFSPGTHASETKLHGGADSCFYSVQIKMNTQI